MSLPNEWLRLAWMQAWQVTVLITAVAVLTRVAAANRPHLAYVLWMVVFIKCLTPPLWSSPSGVFCWLQPPSIRAHTPLLMPPSRADQFSENQTVTAVRA